MREGDFYKAVRPFDIRIGSDDFRFEPGTVFGPVECVPEDGVGNGILAKAIAAGNVKLVTRWEKLLDDLFDPPDRPV